MAEVNEIVQDDILPHSLAMLCINLQSASQSQVGRPDVCRDVLQRDG